jgi:F-box/leucine-rich repeat protein 14
MKRLSLHGCNQISTISLRAISNLVNLEFLDLSNCRKLTLDGMLRIGKSCRQLTQVSLASCGDCISDAVVEALVVHLKVLVTVNLSFCPRVGERSLRALANCEKLQSFDASGCVSVTDQAILRLCDGEFNPGLRHLFLDGELVLLICVSCPSSSS